MIVVTGATGKLNGAAVNHLFKRIPAGEIGVSVRDVSKAQALADRGIRVRQGSYDDPQRLRESFEGAEQVLLVSSSDHGADVVAQHRNAIEAAVDAGVRRIYYTSSLRAGFDTPYPPLAMHAATESLLAESGVAWTALRNGFFGPLDQLLGPWQETGVIAKPATGRFSWIDRADAAEVAANLLVGDRVIDGPVELTASEPVTLEDFARFASELSDREIRRVVVDDEEWVAGEVKNGVPETMARFTLSMFQATRTGYFENVEPEMVKLLGRKPLGPAELLANEYHPSDPD